MVILTINFNYDDRDIIQNKQALDCQDKSKLLAPCYETFNDKHATAKTTFSLYIGQTVSLCLPFTGNAEY